MLLVRLVCRMNYILQCLRLTEVIPVLFQFFLIYMSSIFKQKLLYSPSVSFTTCMLQLGVKMCIRSPPNYGSKLQAF